MRESRTQEPARPPARLTRGLVCAALALALAVPFAISSEREEELSRPIETDQVKAATHAASRGGEVLHLRWKLSGFVDKRISRVSNSPS